MAKFIGKPGIEKKTRYKPGEEIKESEPTCVVLERLGLAERVSEDDEKQKPQPAPRGKPPRQEYVTRDMQAQGRAVTPGHAVGAVTTANIRQPASPVLPEPPAVTSPEPQDEK